VTIRLDFSGSLDYDVDNTEIKKKKTDFTISR